MRETSEGSGNLGTYAEPEESVFRSGFQYRHRRYKKLSILTVDSRENETKAIPCELLREARCSGNLGTCAESEESVIRSIEA